MVLQCSGHPLILSTMGLWKAADCPFHPLETSSLITVFLSEHSHFHAALANKGPAFFPRCFTSFVTYFPQKLCSFQKVTKKNLQFSFLSFFFFFFCLFSPFSFDVIMVTHQTGHCSQHCDPPSHSTLATPSHFAASLCCLAYDLNEHNCSV